MVAEILAFSVAIIGVAVFFTQKDLLKVKKSLGELETAIVKEDEKINENFKKVHESLDLAEREIKHALTVAEKTQRKQSNPFKAMGKKASKFLTPKGKIKKHYRDSPIAQQYYERFHSLQNI